MILSGPLVQRKGFGFSFTSAKNRLMAAWNATRDFNTLGFNRRLVNSAKKPSTALIHDVDEGGDPPSDRCGLAKVPRGAVEKILRF